MTELPANRITIDQGETAPTGKPVPPRYWWLKRILVVLGVLFGVLLGVRLWWGWEADRRLQAEIDRYIAAGEPIYPADFDPPPMSMEENAAKLYLEAEATLGVNPTQGDFVGKLVGEYAEIRKRMDEVETFVLANAKAFELIHRAGKMEKIDWGGRIRSPVFNFMFANLSAHRQMSKTLSIAATYHAEQGDGVAAATTLLDAIRFTEAVDDEPMLIGHLVAIACRALAAKDIEYVAGKLAVERQPGIADLRPRTVPRELVLSLVAELLDERNHQTAFVRSMQAERLFMLDGLPSLNQGGAGIASPAGWGAVGPPSRLERTVAFPITPMLKLDVLAGLQFNSSLVVAAGQANWPAAATKFLPDPEEWSALTQLTRPLSFVAIGSVERAIYLHFRSLAMTRMAATALAIRLYEVDHEQRPEKLTELVPHYLPAIPADPLAAGDRPIGYLPDASKPLLYSVGEDGKDDGGSYTLHASGYANGTVDVKKLDLPFFLDGDRPTRTPEDDSTEGDGDGDEVDSGGGDSK